MTVKFEVKQKTASAQAVRNEGGIPGIVYGPKQEPVSISVNKVAFEKLLKEAGESTVINLVGLGAEIEVLIHDVAFNGQKGGVEHVDFYAIEKGKEITVHVQLEFIGEAPAVKAGGSLTKVLHEVEVTCAPSVLPQHIEVDVSALVDFDAQIHVSDITVPKGVTINNSPEEVVALVQESEVDAPEEVVAAEAVTPAEAKA